MRIIELLPIREWEEKEKDKPTGWIRIYAGGLLVGKCQPEDNFDGDIPKYYFHSCITEVTYKMRSSAMTMHEIKIEVELALKEFITKFVKTYKTLKPANND